MSKVKKHDKDVIHTINKVKRQRCISTLCVIKEKKEINKQIN